MNIVLLRIKNFLSISDAEIVPGAVNQITGGNNQGKTSILKAIEFAIQGSSDGSLVKFGQEDAEVIVELSDKTRIRRRITADGKQSVTVDREGARFQSPQTLLENLFETSSFNPLELLDPKKRSDAILNSIDLKVTPADLAKQLCVDEKDLPPMDYGQHGLKVLEQCHKYFYQRRAEANKTAAEKKKRWETYQADLPTEDSKPKITKEQAVAEIEAVESQVAQAEQAFALVDQRHQQANERMVEAKKAEKRVEELDAKVRFFKSEMEQAEAAKAEAKQATQRLLDAIPADLPSRDSAAEKRNALRVDMERKKAVLKDFERYAEVEKRQEMVARMNQEFKEAFLHAEVLTKRVEALAGPIKKSVMSTAEMPITGLEYTSKGFLVDGVPVDNLSSSKALQLAIGVARKLAKKTKLICVDGAEALDQESYDILRKEIDGDGYTYFVTVVGNGFTHEGDKVIKMDHGDVQ